MTQALQSPRRLPQWLGFGLIALVLLSIVFNERYQSHQNVIDHEMARLQTLARLSETNLALHLQAIDQMLTGLRDQQAQALATQPHRRTLPTSRELRDLAQKTPGSRTVSVMSPSGEVIASSRPELVGVDGSQRPYFQKARQTRDPLLLIISEPFLTVLQAYSIQMIRPILGEHHEFLGAVTVTLDPNFFLTMLKTAFYADDLRCLLMHEDGVVFQAVGDFKPEPGFNLDKPGSLLRVHKENGATESLINAPSYSTRDHRIGVLRTLTSDKLNTDKHLILSFTRNADKLLAPWQKDTLQLTALLSGVLALGAMALLFHQRRQHAAWLETQRLTTLRQTAEAQEQRAAREIEDLYDNAPCGYHSLDDKGVFLRINQTELDWLGLNREDVIGKLRFIDLLTQEDAEKFSQNFPTFLQTGRIENLAFTLRHKDGTTFTVLASATAVRDDHGNYLFSRTTLTDFSEHLRLENALKDKSELLETVLNNATLSISLVRNRTTIWANPAACKLFGYTPQEMEKKPTHMLFPSLEAYHAEGQLAYGELNTGKTVTRDIQLKHKDGTLFWGRVTLKFVDQNVEPRETIVIIEDITQRMAVERSNRELISLINESPDFIATAGLDKVVRYMNPAGMKLLGYPLDTPPGQIRIRDAHPDWVFEKLQQEVFPAASVQGSWRGELALLDQQGHEIPVYQTVLLHRDEQGQPSHLSTIVRDIRIEKQAEQKLNEAKQAAERANKAKSQFISNMSHDIRTPLNALLNYGQMLETAPLAPTYREQLDRLNLAGNTLLGLVNDILDFSKIEAGELQLSEEPINLQHKLLEISQMMDGIAVQKGLRLIVDPLPDNTPAHYLCDPLRLRQILFNLVGNALKFTQEGWVQIRIRAMPAASTDQQRLRFEVSDTGIGISEEDQARLFTRFTQVDEGVARRFGGTGLGLAIVKELAELMHGKVDVRSTLGQGSTFGVELVLKIASPGDIQQIYLEQQLQTETQSERLQLDGLRILVVDDSDMNLDIAQQLLGQQGAFVQTCENGAQALNFLQDQAQQVDIVLMDVQMPVMDGNTAIQLIRQDPRLRDLPVIAMTAGATRTERELSMQAGMNDYVTKPFQLQSLVKTIQRLMERQHGAPLPIGRKRSELSLEAQASAGWPDIAGLDLTSARQYLSNDWPMFVRQATWFIRDFGRYATVAMPQDGPALKRMLADFHTIAGNAGLIGANAVASCAREAERIARLNDLFALPPALQALNQAVQDLIGVLTPILASEQAASPRENASNHMLEPLNRQDIDNLLDDLTQQRFKAVQRHNKLKRQLAARLSETDASQLDTAMSRMDFAAAKSILMRCQPELTKET